MPQDPTPSPSAYYAETYDASVVDWPGELDFYLRLAQERGQVLELAAGTGRVAIRLARAGIPVTALELSPDMVATGRAKSADLPDLVWVEADMRSFDLGREFALVIVPGHAFLNLLTPEDQMACLSAVRRHLALDGRLVLHLDHQDLDWLGEIGGPGGGTFEDAGTFVHPTTGRHVRTEHAWRYERSTQTAILTTRWSELDHAGAVVKVTDTGEQRIHAAFRFEIEHALARAGFAVEAVHGDFEGGPRADESEEMIVVARPGSSGG